MYAIRQAISTSHNVSTQLSMCLFDRQIEPVLLYGSPVWDVPSCTYTLKICGYDRINIDTKTASYKYLESIGAHDIELNVDATDSIAITVCNVSDKIKIINEHMKAPNTFTIEEIQKKASNDIERSHSNFCKFSLWVSKYVSTNLTLGEIDRYPIQIRLCVLAALYWLRLVQGTKIFLLTGHLTL